MYKWVRTGIVPLLPLRWWCTFRMEVLRLVGVEVVVEEEVVEMAAGETGLGQVLSFLLSG